MITTQAWMTWIQSAPSLVASNTVGALALASSGWFLGASGRQRWWSTIPLVIGAGGLGYAWIQSPSTVHPVVGAWGVVGALVGLLAWTIHIRRQRHRVAADPPDAVRQRIRENFAQNDLAPSGEGSPVEPLALTQAPLAQESQASSEAREAGLAAESRTFGSTEEEVQAPSAAHFPGVRYDAEKDVLLISFGWTHAAARREVTDPQGQAIAGFFTVHDLSDDETVVGVEIHGFLSQWQPQWAKPAQPVVETGPVIHDLIAEIRATLATYEQQLAQPMPLETAADMDDTKTTETPSSPAAPETIENTPTFVNGTSLERVAETLSRRLSPVLAEALYDVVHQTALTAPGDAR